GSANSLLMTVLVARCWRTPACASVQQAGRALLGRRLRLGVGDRRAMMSDHAPAAAGVRVHVGGDDRARLAALAQQRDVFVDAVHRQQSAANLLRSAQLEVHAGARAEDLAKRLPDGGEPGEARATGMD